MMDKYIFRKEDEQKRTERIFEGNEKTVMGTVKVGRLVVPVGHRAHHIVFHFDFDGV